MPLQCCKVEDLGLSAQKSRSFHSPRDLSGSSEKYRRISVTDLCFCATAVAESIESGIVMVQLVQSNVSFNFSSDLNGVCGGKA